MDDPRINDIPEHGVCSGCFKIDSVYMICPKCHGENPLNMVCHDCYDNNTSCIKCEAHAVRKS